MTKPLAQIAYEARFGHLPPREWTPWTEVVDPVVLGLWAKVGMAVQMAVTERMAAALQEHTRSYLSADQPSVMSQTVIDVAEAMTRHVPVRNYGNQDPTHPWAGEVVTGPDGQPLIPQAIIMPAATSMRPLDLVSEPPMPLGIDPAALTHLDLVQMRDAGLIKSWTEDNDTGAYRIEFAEPLPHLKLATTPAMQQHIEALVEGMAKDGAK